MATSPTAPALGEISKAALWAGILIKKQIADIQTAAKDLPNGEINELLPAAGALGEPQTAAEKSFKVGIIGAGVAGLFTAMIFDHLKKQYGLDVDYEILEANEPARLGGRLYTYKFPFDPSVDKSEEDLKHQYYDVGAMRFPEVKTMKRTFDLFRTLKMNEVKDPKAQAPGVGDLIPYLYNGTNAPLQYNSIQRVLQTGPTANDFSIPDLPENIRGADAGKLADGPISSYKDTYYDGEDGPKKFWKQLMESADAMSVRQYFKVNQDYNYNTIEFLETMNFGNRWYDQAVSEMILESLDFDSDAVWWCVEGGAQEIAKRMAASLQQSDKIKYHQKVIALAYKDGTGEIEDQVNVTIKGHEDQPRSYDSVFNSAPLGAMQHMQLEGLKLNYGTKQAIRSLGYGASCKVGIRFKSLWWRQAPYNITGGVARTDLPIRCCVYPSYNVHDDVDKPGVLLASYTWSQEANRIGSLIGRNSPDDEDELKDVLFHDLARLHTNDEKSYLELRARLEREYISHHAWDWYANKNSVGAFAFFGPGQFKNMYPWITRSDGKHAIIGEAASAHHAWVVGALESASRAVYQFINRHRHVDCAAQKAAAAFEANEVPGPFGPIPAEYDRTQDVQASQPKQGAAVDASPYGDLARWQVLVEKTRLKQGGADQLVCNGETFRNNILPAVVAS